jgi:hypothetical protein
MWLRVSAIRFVALSGVQSSDNAHGVAYCCRNVLNMILSPVPHYPYHIAILHLYILSPVPHYPYYIAIPHLYVLSPVRHYPYHIAIAHLNIHTLFHPHLGPSQQPGGEDQHSAKAHRGA